MTPGPIRWLGLTKNQSDGRVIVQKTNSGMEEELTCIDFTPLFTLLPLQKLDNEQCQSEQSTVQRVYTVLCRVCSVKCRECTLYCVECAVCSAGCAVESVHCAVHDRISDSCDVYRVADLLCSALCLVYSAI